MGGGGQGSPLLAKSPFPGAGPLRRRLGQRYQSLHAAEVITAPRGKAFAAFRARAGDVPADASVDAEGKALDAESMIRELAKMMDIREIDTLLSGTAAAPVGPVPGQVQSATGPRPGRRATPAPAMAPLPAGRPA